MIVVRVEHRGQRLDFAAPSEVTGDELPLLSAVSDWYERGSVAQVPGHEQGETPSATITLDNHGNQSAVMLAYPVGAKVSIFEDGEEKLRGQCVRFALGPSIELSVEV